MSEENISTIPVAVSLQPRAKEPRDSTNASNDVNTFLQVSLFLFLFSFAPEWCLEN
jgi:hypothetical protein